MTTILPKMLLEGLNFYHFFYVKIVLY